MNDTTNNVSFKIYHLVSVKYWLKLMKVENLANQYLSNITNIDQYLTNVTNITDISYIGFFSVSDKYQYIWVKFQKY